MAEARVATRRCALALLFGAAAMSPATGHSLDDLEGEIGRKEQYFQPMGKTAPGFTLREPAGTTVRLADLHGKVVVLNFVYASCLDVCPLHAERIAEIQAMVNRTPMKERVQFVTITTDPLRDTVEILRGYGPIHGLDPVNWIMLTTPPGRPADETRALAAAYGHQFAVANDGSQRHGIVTHVIDQTGRWRANFHGLRFEPLNVVLLINALLNDHHADGGRSGGGFWSRLKGLF